MSEASNHDAVSAVSWSAGAIALLGLAGRGAYLERRRQQETATQWTPPSPAERLQTNTPHEAAYPDIPYNGSPFLEGEENRYWNYPSASASAYPVVEPRMQRPACLQKHFAENPEDFEPGDKLVCGAEELGSNKTTKAICPFAASVVAINAEGGTPELVLKEHENSPRCADELGMLRQAWKYVG